jgi:eukaryotic-like serine/threonine-protein kinase
VTDDYQAGEVIDGRYRILGKIGGGGMANVYLAEDTTLGRRVAVKLLHRRFVEDAKFVERFRREAKAAAGLNHPNIVGVYDWGQVGSENYIVMEYVEGDTLKELIRRRGRLPGGEAVAIALELLAAVGAAHGNAVIHRDVKSQNILMDRAGRVKVTDFGIAQAGDPGMTEAGSILGTAQYLAPEQARGEPVDERSDLYSVGVVLYEMLTGRVPFKGDSAVTVALKHVNELPPEPAELVPGLPYSLNQIVLKALAKDPNRRYGSAAEFAADLRAAQTGGPLRAAAFDPADERTQVVAPIAIPGEQATRVMSAARAGAPVRGGRNGAANGRLPRRRRPPVWVILVVLAALAAVAAGGVLIYNAAFGSSGGVPGVVGLSEQAAHDKLTEAGYKVARHDEYSDQFAAGFVSRQQPKAGISLRSGGIVDIWVSKGSTTVSLKDLTGLPAAEVTDYLKTNGLVGDRHTGRSDAVAPGEVYRQSPSPGDVKRGSTVAYWVSGGVPQVVVPDVTLMSGADAAAKLNADGLNVGASTSQASDTVPIGEVISQDPPAGRKVDKGSKVDLVISSGPTSSPSPSVTPTATPSSSPTSGLVTVPSVITMDQGTAEQTLKAQGFLVVVSKVTGGVQPTGTVVDQDPPPNSRAGPGSTVTIFVAQ